VEQTKASLVAQAASRDEQGARSSVWQEPAWRGAGETGVQPQLPRLPRKQSGSCQSPTAAIAPARDVVLVWHEASRIR
jgi:hypothetical protein